MDHSTQWTFPPELQPRQEELEFDLDAALSAVVQVRAEIPEQAFTASVLGTERMGSAVVIRADGLLLTIGYLIAEAQSIWITGRNETVVPGHALAWDPPSGLGLVLPLGKLGVAPLDRGSAAAIAEGDAVTVIGNGGRAHALKASLVARHEFAGSWEYVLDEALFTSPAHPQWGGTALIGTDGRLAGIGSLLVQERSALGGETDQGNMFVPVDELEPIFDDLLRTGRRAGPPRPWLGLYAIESQGVVVVTGLADGGPAARAGMREGDHVVEVAGKKVGSLAEIFRSVWELGPAGVEVPLTLSRKGVASALRVRSIDRFELLVKPSLH